nr:hypothetical protein [Herbiconiux sp. VKM Ac-2851]
MIWYNDLAAEVQKSIASLDWASLLGPRPPDVTSRGKTRDTLVQKLRRQEDVPLHLVQDIAGVRFEADMTLDEQDAVAVAIAGLFGLPADSSAIKDMREAHHSGYRAVHIWLQLEGRVEIQIRTQLQGEWANMYERASDVFGRDIRYGALPIDGTARKIVEAVQQMSYEKVATSEYQRNEMHLLQLGVEESDLLPGSPPSIIDKTDIRDRLTALQARSAEVQRELRAQIGLLENEFARLRKGEDH